MAGTVFGDFGVSPWQVQYFVTLQVLEWNARTGMNIPVVSQRSFTSHIIMNETRVLIDFVSLLISRQPALTTRDRNSCSSVQCTTEAIPEHFYWSQEATKAQGCNWNLKANSPHSFSNFQQKNGTIEIYDLTWSNTKHGRFVNFAVIRKLGEGDEVLEARHFLCSGRRTSSSTSFRNFRTRFGSITFAS